MSDGRRSRQTSANHHDEEFNDSSSSSIDHDSILDYPDFTQPDEVSSVIIVVEGQKLHLHKEILSVWSPVFKSMFVQPFKEKEMYEIDLPNKKMDDFVELLHCIYPPIKPISDCNVKQILPLSDEYQILEIKRKCEDHLLTVDASIESLVIAQTYNLPRLLHTCIKHARKKTYEELIADPNFKVIEPSNLILILGSRVQNLEERLRDVSKKIQDRDSKLYGYINEFGSQFGNFCQDCKTRRVSDNCISCLKMFRDKVKSKVEEARTIRNQFPRIDL